MALASPANGSNDFGRGDDPELSFVNGAWVNKGLKLKPSFQEIVQVVYNAMAKEVDFENKPDEVVAEINTWAETATRGLIKNLVTPEALSSFEGADLILSNAVYFKGTWAQLFDTSKCQHRVFHLPNGQTVDVSFMTSVEFEYYRYRSFDGYKVLKLPYNNGHQTTRKFAMYFFLPDAIDGLPKLLQLFKYNPEYFNQRFDLLQESFSDFWIPRFKFSFEFEASDTMKGLGLNLPFELKNAEITEMVDLPCGLCVRNMFQKSFIEVNEKVTRAAACTFAIAHPVCLRYPIPSFVADHPFMFMTKEEMSGIVFVIGAMLNPLLES